MNGQSVYQFKRKADEEVRISLSHYKGARYVDLRIFYISKEDGEFKPTRKGITLNLDLLSELEKGIAMLKEAILSTNQPEETIA